MRLRHITLIIFIAILTPAIKNTIVYAGEMKSTYDSVREIQNSPEFGKLVGRMAK